MEANIDDALLDWAWTVRKTRAQLIDYIDTAQAHAINLPDKLESDILSTRERLTKIGDPIFV